MFFLISIKLVTTTVRKFLKMMSTQILEQLNNLQKIIYNEPP